MTEPLTSSTEAPSKSAPQISEALGLHRLKAERIQLALLELPGWVLGAEAESITRFYALPTEEAAVILLCLIAELSRAQGHEAKLLIFGRHLTVTLSSPESRGVTEADLDLARQISFAA
ncbi:MAG: 4a-hydroxytetrahydrobiopterin dehydratase [Acidobacteriota bacterium]